MQEINTFVSKYYFWVILGLSLAAIWALFVPGFYGASDDVHIAWLYEMDYIIRIWQFPPRFVPDLSFGFGYPLFNFVFPLPYYIAEIFHLGGFSLVDSIKILFGITIPVSMLGMYILGKRFTQPMTALAMSVLYGYAPYRAVDLYIRGAIGEIVALMFLPYLVWVVFEQIGSDNPRRSRQYIFGGGLLLTGFVLSHNITAYMFLPWLVILALMLIFISAKNKVVKLLNIGMMFGLGVVGSSYFWVTALIESGFMKYDTVFNYIDHFPTLKQLVTPYWGYGASVPGPYDGMSFFLGYSNLLVCGVMTVVIFRNRNKLLGEARVLLIWVFVMLSWAFFMMNFRSSFVWDAIPLIGQFQFPWRFLMLVSLGIPMLMIGLGKGKYSNVFVFLVIVVTLVFNFGYFRPQDFLGRTDEYFLKKYLVFPSVDQLYLTQREEYLRLPVINEARPEKVYPDFYGFGGQIRSENVNRLDLKAKINLSNDQAVSVNKYNFPGWKGAVDGREVDIVTAKPFGQISLNVPSGEHWVRVWYTESSLRLFFDILSACWVILMMFGYVLTSWRFRNKVE